MRSLQVCFAILFVSILVGCAQPAPSESKPAPRMDLAAEEAAIRATDVQWQTAKDMDKALSFWTDDATLYMPGTPPVAGKKAIKEYVAGAMASPGFSISWVTEKIIVAPSGTMAYSTGTNQVTFQGPAGKLITTRNNAVVVWKKLPDGTWKSVIDISTPQPTPAPAIAAKK